MMLHLTILTNTCGLSALASSSYGHPGETCLCKAMTLNPVTLFQLVFSQDVEICVSAESPAMVVEPSSSSSQLSMPPHDPVMEPVSDHEGVASSGTPVAVAHTRSMTTRPVIANSSHAVVRSDILSVPADHSSFWPWERVSHSVGVLEQASLITCLCSSGLSLIGHRLSLIFSQLLPGFQFIW